ncbi:MAG: sigma 54-interacting transcriptional regulator [Myxococcota bacterium]
MHRLTWISPNDTTTWTVDDGLLHLPESARQQGMEAVIVCGAQAMLVGGDAMTPLAPGRAIGCAAGELTWNLDERARPTPIGVEPTQRRAEDVLDIGLRLVTGGDEGINLGSTPIVVGRHPACTLRLDDRQVSSLHCLLQQTPNGVRVLDLGSRNGTLVRASPACDVLVRSRSIIRVGNTRLLVAPELAGPSPASLPSPQMKRLDDTLQRIAPSDAPVLIQGETGVGKDSVACRVHELSGRAGRFVALNAAAITETLAGSELFGHVRGAFTGADTDRDGAFVVADGGTLFLDEVAELPPRAQAELLRVVEQGKIRPLGTAHEVPVDVRIVAATHRDLAARVRSGRFREDLYHRLCVVPVTVPPLRQRPKDLDFLARQFLATEPEPRRLDAAAWKKLRNHLWPGNIRELRHTLHRACLLTDGERLRPSNLQIHKRPRRVEQVDALMHERVMQVYIETGASVVDTAARLGLHRATVYKHLKVARRGQAPDTHDGGRCTP